MDVQVLNEVVFYLWKKSQATSMVGMWQEFKIRGIDLNIMELEHELQSRDIILSTYFWNYCSRGCRNNSLFNIW